MASNIDRLSANPARRETRRRSSVDALTLAQMSCGEPIVDVYAQSDTRAMKNWRKNRPEVNVDSDPQVYSLPPRYKWNLGSPYLLGPDRCQKKGTDRSEVLAVDSSGQSPECQVCLGAYTDSEADMVPRSLQCGHSLCSGEGVMSIWGVECDVK